MDKLYPYQEVLLDRMSNGGVKPGEMVMMTAGRQTGKSMFTAQALKRLMEDLYNQPIRDLILSEGKVFGARYYTVQPDGGNWLEMEKWARVVYGDPAEIWEASNFMWPDVGRWYMNDRKFWFRDEKDRTMFILKWR